MYRLGIGIAALWQPKAKAWIAGRQQLFTHIQETFKEAPKEVIWFHCASLGEYEQGRPLMERIKEAQPKQKIVLTFFSPSGYETRSHFKGADYVYYLPLDTAKNAAHFIQLIQPKYVVFVKYEFWYHYLSTLASQNIPTYLIAGLFRSDQFFFKWYGQWYLKVLKNFSHLFVQEKSSKVLLEKYNVTNVSIAGDPRIDRVIDIAQTVNHFPIIEQFKQQDLLFIIGSAHQKDIALLLPFIQKNTTWKILIVPHEVDQKSIKYIQGLLPKAQLYTDIESKKCRTPLEVSDTLASNFSTDGQKNNNILIVNTIGLLSQLYRYADVAYIGGGFDTGIHNILEPAVFGLPILIGPKYQKFEEAKALIGLGGVVMVNNQEQLTNIENQLVHVEYRHAMGLINKNYLLAHQGGTVTIFNKLLEKTINTSTTS